MAKWIISHFPEDYENYAYLEPYCGGANVLLNKQKSKVLEAINDIDENIIQIYRALRDEPKEFSRRLSLCKYCQETFDRAAAKNKFDDYLDRAVNEFILRRMSRGGLKKAFAWSERLRGGQPGDVNAWKNAVKDLPILADRLREVHIFNRPAVEIIRAFNNKNTLVYCDPPYLIETRTAKIVYSSEMTTDDHIELGRLLNQFQGKALISGYPSPLYNRLYSNWNCVKKKIANHSSQQKTKEKKTECLWKNF